MQEQLAGHEVEWEVVQCPANDEETAHFVVECDLGWRASAGHDRKSERCGEPEWTRRRGEEERRSSEEERRRGAEAGCGVEQGITRVNEGQ